MSELKSMAIRSHDGPRCGLFAVRYSKKTWDLTAKVTLFSSRYRSSAIRWEGEPAALESLCFGIPYAVASHKNESRQKSPKSKKQQARGKEGGSKWQSLEMPSSGSVTRLPLSIHPPGKDGPETRRLYLKIKYIHAFISAGEVYRI